MSWLATDLCGYCLIFFILSLTSTSLTSSQRSKALSISSFSIKKWKQSCICFFTFVDPDIGIGNSSKTFLLSATFALRILQYRQYSGPNPHAINNYLGHSTFALSYPHKNLCTHNYFRIFLTLIISLCQRLKYSSDGHAVIL